MEELIETVTELLNANFSGDNHTELDVTIPGQKIGGSFVSSEFVGMAQTDRQTAVRDVLRANLPPVDLLSVGLILTLTPQEVTSMQGTALAA